MKNFPFFVQRMNLQMTTALHLLKHSRYKTVADRLSMCSLKLRPSTIKQDQNIVKINLSHNEFSEKAGVAFGKWLGNSAFEGRALKKIKCFLLFVRIGDNHILIDLDLSWNHIRKKGALQIARGLSVSVFRLAFRRVPF